MRDILEFPLISIAIVNLNGKDYLENCLQSIRKLDYPDDKIEVVIVDNGSSDSSISYLESEHKQVRLIKNDKNMGFAYANNQAAGAAKGEYIAFLNNDTRVDSKWLIELLKPIYGDKETVASGSKVLSMDGKKLDFVGGMINFEGKGFQIDFDLPIEKDLHKQYKYLPFANGGAMLIRRDIFLDVGGFDEDFFAYYEDVDLGWRLWVLGYKVIFAPDSIVYHHHHGTSRIFSEDKLRFLKERNSLYSVFKNYDDSNLARAFSGTLANIFNRVFVDLDFDYRKYYDLSTVKTAAEADGDHKAAPGGSTADKEEVCIAKEPLSSLAAAKNFFDELPRLMEKRKKIQGARKRDDKAVFAYFKAQFMPVSSDPVYQRNHIDILESLGMHKVFEKEIKRTLAIITSEVVASEMAGPAIRVWNFAKELSEHMNVILAIPNKADLGQQDFQMVQYKDEGHLKEIIKDADVLLCNGMTLSKFRSLKNMGKYLIIDIYDPYNLATLAEYSNENMKERLEIHKSIQKYFNEQFYYGDFFICASDRQRDFWLGMLAALNRVNPFAYNIDPTMKRMISVVPFGLPSNRPIHTEDVLKGKVKGINKGDFVIIWGGGIYNWFDPLTLVKAMAAVKEKRSDIKLFFMGVKHPNPEVKALQMVNDTVELAKKLELYDENIFFNFGWVDYGERQNYFLESDAGIITHPEHIETRFSFRTRILDYLWAGLPIISTEGDHLSDLVKINRLGLVTKEGSAEELAEAILKLAGDSKFHQECVENTTRIAADFTWDKVCRPIIDFCRDPVSNALKSNNSPDPQGVEDSRDPGSGRDPSGRKSKKRLMGRFFYHLFRSGPRSTTRYISNYMSQK
ncbi:MAG: glycosyltransferase [Candidatus Humimicrobiaceae bacterium]